MKSRLVRLLWALVLLLAGVVYAIRPLSLERFLTSHEQFTQVQFIRDDPRGRTVQEIPSAEFIDRKASAQRSMWRSGMKEGKLRLSRSWKLPTSLQAWLDDDGTIYLSDDWGGEYMQGWNIPPKP